VRQKRTTGEGLPPVRIAKQERAVRHGGDEIEGYGSLLDYEAAARYLCTTPRDVRELWAKRRLAAIRVGRSVRFAKSDLDAFIKANRVGVVR
jgi:excisionase family DNA binding protein